MSKKDVQTAPEDLASQVIESVPCGPVQWRVIVLCFVFNMLDGFDITAMAVVANEVVVELGLSAEQLGWIFSFSLAGMTFGAMFLSPFSDTIGRRKIILLSALLVGMAVLLTAYATSLYAFIVLRFIAGLGAGVMLATQASLAFEYSKLRYRSLFVASVTAGYPLGAMMTSVVASYVTPSYGWPGMFVFGGVLTLIMLTVAWFLLPESLSFLLSRRHSVQSGKQTQLAQVNRLLCSLHSTPLDSLPENVKTEAKRSPLQCILSLLTAQYGAATLKLWGIFLLAFCTLYFLLSWTPKLIQDAGFSAQDGRDAFFLLNLGGVLGIFIVGYLSTLFSISRVVTVLMIGAAAGLMTFDTQISESLSWTLCMIFITGLLLQGGFTGMYSVAAKIYPTELRSTGVGWAIGLGRFGAVAGPAIAGYLVAYGLPLGQLFWLFSLPIASAALISMFLRVR